MLWLLFHWAAAESKSWVLPAVAFLTPHPSHTQVKDDGKRELELVVAAYRPPENQSNITNKTRFYVPTLLEIQHAAAVGISRTLCFKKVNILCYTKSNSAACIKGVHLHNSIDIGEGKGAFPAAGNQMQLSFWLPRFHQQLPTHFQACFHNCMCSEVLGFTPCMKVEVLGEWNSAPINPFCAVMEMQKALVMARQLQNTHTNR